jgi:hypothetical protein
MDKEEVSQKTEEHKGDRNKENNKPISKIKIK